MRLILGKTDHLNTNLTDEQGNVLYNISTPTSFFTQKVTTIRKYGVHGGEIIGIIEWPRLLDKGQFQFEGKTIRINDMFKTHMWSTGLHFVGPDQKGYKWKISPRCWMKPAEADVELVRFHRKNMGIMKSAHPPYLDVAPSVVWMLDLIILTFVYAEWKRQEVERGRQASANASSAAAASAAAAATTGC